MAFRDKFNRAVEQLVALESSMDAWIKTDPYSIARHTEHDTGEHVLTALLRTDPTHVEWSLALGDCLHNFRSSLDQLTYELALKHTVAAMSDRAIRQSEFPIFGDRAPTLKEVADKIGCIHPDAQAIIERLQPHHRGHPDYLSDPLWVLHELGNVDKHRTLHFVGAAQTGAEVVNQSGPMTISNTLLGPMNHGTELLRWETQTKVEVQFRVSFVVSFSDESPAGQEPVIATLWAIATRIKDDVFGPLASYLR